MSFWFQIECQRCGARWECGSEAMGASSVMHEDVAHGTGDRWSMRLPDIRITPVETSLRRVGVGDDRSAGVSGPGTHHALGPHATTTDAHAEHRLG